MCFGNGITSCTNAFPKTTPIWQWPLLPCQVSQYTRMKEIMSRVFARIRDERWLPSVPRMTRTHTTVIAHFKIGTQNKNKVTCIHESMFASISVHIYIYQKWETPIMYMCMHPYVFLKICSIRIFQSKFGHVSKPHTAREWRNRTSNATNRVLEVWLVLL